MRLVPSLRIRCVESGDICLVLLPRPLATTSAPYKWHCRHRHRTLLSSPSCKHMPLYRIRTAFESRGSTKIPEPYANLVFYIYRYVFSSIFNVCVCMEMQSVRVWNFLYATRNIFNGCWPMARRCLRSHMRIYLAHTIKYGTGIWCSLL